MELKQRQSDSCTYNRKLRHVFHNITTISNPRPQLNLQNSTLIKTGTIGLLSCIIIILVFAVIVQYSYLQNITTCFSEDLLFAHNSQQTFPAATESNQESVVKPGCECDSTITSSSVPQSSLSSNQIFGSSSSRETTANIITGRRKYHSIKQQLEIAESIWESSVAQRHQWIASTARNNLSSINPWDGTNYVFFWNYFSPSFNCPHSVQRVGFIGDGGKWICGLELYEMESLQNNQRNNGDRIAETAETSRSTATKPSCIIYSFGVANESSFEAEMLNRTNCQVFAYDYSVKTIGFPVEPTNARVTFKALGIGNKNLGKFRTLKYLMDQNGHEWIDILKMDIEGGEYAALDKVMQDFSGHAENNGTGNSGNDQNESENIPILPFGQLLLELHVDGKIFPKFYEWWERLEARGLRAFFSEVNHVACAVAMVKPNFVEYSFINIRGKHRLVQQQL